MLNEGTLKGPETAESIKESHLPSHRLHNNRHNVFMLTSLDIAEAIDLTFAQWCAPHC